MDLDQVTGLIQSFQIRELRSLLFTPDASLRTHYLRHKLLQNLPTILPINEKDGGERSGDRRDMAYTIIEFERSNRHPEDFTRILHASILKAAKNRDALLVEVMIHSGGNLFYSNPDDSTTGNIFDEISQIPEMAEVIDKYFPGIWNAVETGNIDDLRRLVNCWCSTDVYYDGEFLIQLAHRVGHESVIRLVTGAHYTLKLIHSFLGGNVPAIQALLHDHPAPISILSEYGINMDFKHLSDRGAPLIYYVIQRNEVEIARLLVQKGCKIYTLMPCPENSAQDNDQSQGTQQQQLQDVPVFHAALSNPDLDPEMMSALLSYCDQDPEKMHDLLYRMMFQGKNCLELAIHSSLNLDAFRILISRSGAKVIADRNESCKTARDVAIEKGRQDYADIIDSCVIEYLQHPGRHPHQRQILALFGYDLSDLVLHESPVDPFYSLYQEYQSQIKRLAKAITDDDYESFQSLSVWRREDDLNNEFASAAADADTASSSASSVGIAVAISVPLFERLLIWDAREGQINPLPLLHRAVIHHRINVVKFILDLKPSGQNVDCLFDHYRRTALHYAESSKDLEEVRTLLRLHGSSDHALDRVSLCSSLSSGISISIRELAQYLFISLSSSPFDSLDNRMDASRWTSRCCRERNP